VQSGTDEGTDASFVQNLTGFDADHFYDSTYLLREPLSPHAAAKIDGVEIDMKRFALPSFTQNTLVIEGAGGVLVPLNQQSLIIDLIQQLDVPAIVVARSTLGTINHTLLTLQALRSRSIRVLGVILNGPKNPGNAQAIAEYGATEILAQIEHGDLNELINQNPLSHLASLHADENRRAAAAGATRGGMLS
jgi:dethiobiotin synthase